MLVGICEIDVLIHQAGSLKEKRAVIKSLKDKISKQFNVSIAEIGYQNKWQRALLGIAKVSNDNVSIDKVFSLIDKLITEDGRCEIISFNKRLT